MTRPSETLCDRTYCAVMWFVVGGALMLLGGLLTWRMTRTASDSRAIPGSGLATAVGLALVFWGLVAVAVGLVTRG